jgi:hypothetical protein
MFMLQIYQIVATMPLMLDEAPYFCIHASSIFVIHRRFFDSVPFIRIWLNGDAKTGHHLNY